MNLCKCVVLLAAVCDGLRTGPRPLTSRRAVLAGALVLPVAAGTASAAGDDLIDVYFGCGCFWHVQHELVEAERRILGRSDSELTAFTGYAGGRAGLRDGKVCYHNAAQVSDYSSLGHAEVVGMRIPRASFGDFAAEYCKLFDKNGFRPDQLGDRGSEYRNLVAMPGGSTGELAKELVRASPLLPSSPFLLLPYQATVQIPLSPARLPPRASSHTHTCFVRVPSSVYDQPSHIGLSSYRAVCDGRVGQ
jgi:peptide methionine sulfoxide reductase MsrA